MPPPNSARGAAAILSAKAFAEAASEIFVHGTAVTCSAGPVHCIMMTAIDCAGPDWIAADHARMAERRDVTLLLQLEPELIDTARSIDREHECKVDRLSTAALRRGGAGQPQRQNQDRKEAECGAHALM